MGLLPGFPMCMLEWKDCKLVMKQIEGEVTSWGMRRMVFMPFSGCVSCTRCVQLSTTGRAKHRQLQKMVMEESIRKKSI